MNDMLPTELPPDPNKNELLDVIKVALKKYLNEPEFRKYIAAFEDKDAITGSVDFDRAFAAKYIWDKSIEDGTADVVHAKSLKKVAQAIETILRRYKLGANQRLEQFRMLESQKKEEKSE
jgi:hypothetical protein